MSEIVQQAAKFLGIQFSAWRNDLRITEIIIDLWNNNVRASGGGWNIHLWGRHYTIYLIEWSSTFMENEGGHWN